MSLPIFFVFPLFTICSTITVTFSINCDDSLDSIIFLTQSISSALFSPVYIFSNTQMQPSPIAATIEPAMIAFSTLAPMLIPGIAFNALIAVFAATLTVPTSTIELNNCLVCSSLLISQSLASELIWATSIGDRISASAIGIGIAPTVTAAVVEATTIL